MAVRDNTQPIKLSDDDLTKLSNFLREKITEAEAYHSGFDDLHAEYWRWYYARPETETKNTPWELSCNIVAPTIRVAVDTTAALVYDAMFASMPTVTGQGEEDVEAAERLSRFYFDFIWNGAVLDLKTLANDWNLDTFIDGTSDVKIFWDRSRFLHRERTITQKPRTKKTTMELLGQPLEIEEIVGFDQDIDERVIVRSQERPSVEVVDMTKLKIFPGSGPDIQYPECSGFYEDVEWTWDEALSRRQRGWDFIDDELKKSLQETQQTQRESEKESDEGLAPSEPETVPVKVFNVRLVLPGTIRLDDGTENTQRFLDPDGYPEEVVIWYFPSTNKVSKITPLSRIRPDGLRQHVDARYGRIPRSFYGLGIPSTLRHVAELTTTSLRQMVDYGTLRNLPWAFYEPATMGITHDKIKIKPGAFIPTLNAGGVRPMQFQGDNSHFLQVITQARIMAEQMTSVTDLVQGRAAAIPNAPRTARGQAQALRQSNFAFSYRVALMSERYRRLFRMVHALYQKHAPEEITFRFFNKATGLFQSDKVKRDDFLIDADFQFQLGAARELVQQVHQVMFQLLMPLLANPATAANRQIRSLAKQVYESHALKNFNTIWPETLTQVQAGQGLMPGAEQSMLPGTPIAPPPIPGLQQFPSGNLSDMIGADTLEPETSIPSGETEEGL